MFKNPHNYYGIKKSTEKKLTETRKISCPGYSLWKLYGKHKKITWNTQEKRHDKYFS